MIGNDIVDVAYASIRHRWQEQRFIDKVFSFDEQKLIAIANNQFQAIWLLWTMKESAYKIHVRRYVKHFFAPEKIVCHLSATKEGSVSICKDIYHTTSSVSKEYIYTIARSNASKNVIGGCYKLEDASYVTQHSESYQRVLRAFSNISNISIDALEIRKNIVGVPEIYNNHKKQFMPFSITHHGHYYGYAMLN